MEPALHPNDRRLKTQNEDNASAKTCMCYLGLQKRHLAFVELSFITTRYINLSFAERHEFTLRSF